MQEGRQHCTDLLPIQRFFLREDAEGQEIADDVMVDCKRITGQILAATGLVLPLVQAVEVLSSRFPDIHVLFHGHASSLGMPKGPCNE